VRFTLVRALPAVAVIRREMHKTPSTGTPKRRPRNSRIAARTTAMNTPVMLGVHTDVASKVPHLPG
jgi:hypothetical protein